MCMYVCVCVCMYMYVWMCMCICVCVYVYVCVSKERGLVAGTLEKVRRKECCVFLYPQPSLNESREEPMPQGSVQKHSPRMLACRMAGVSDAIPNVD